MRPLVLALSLLGLLSACNHPLAVHPPADRAAREARALEAVRRLGQPGDWLVIRGYHATDNVVALATNAPFSHVAVLDPEKDQVIEAEGKGLHVTPLPEFMKKAHRLILMRSQWATSPERQRAAVEKARGYVGRGYDFTGLVGLNVPDRFYCSELAVAVYGPHAHRKEHLPPVLPPADMHFWATILWDSGPVVE
ncbi:MAG TPA: YiiX/YebB-like N1pC/P60 family cysteine hydrolase [Holophagaceae bacterium]|nr:YiiX/YebB-like N1pC/P60 family cysteine hydrolase [Holophagaceae bacterium]